MDIAAERQHFTGVKGGKFQPNGASSPPGNPLEPYGFRSHYLEIDGNRLHYLDEGPRQGEPIVMVHGNPTWSFFFRGLVTALRGDYRVIVPDHMGMGLSDKPDDAHYDYTLASRASDLKRLLSHLGLERDLTFILHDWGGLIGLLHGLRHPGLIRRLVLLNTAAFHLPPGKTFPWQLTLCRMNPVGPLLVRGANGFSRSVGSLIVRRPIDPEVTAGYLYPYDSWRNRISVLRFVQDIGLKPGDRSYALISEVEGALAQLRDTPTLICWGLRDYVFDRRCLEVWQRHLPHAEVHAFEQAGHYVLEDAGDEIATLVRRFLKARPRAPSGQVAPETPAVGGVGANFASRLSHMAHMRPYAIAAVEPRGRDRRGRVRSVHYTFAQLDAESTRIAGALRAVGIGRGVRTVFMIKPGLDCLAFAFAVFKVGAVLVGIDPGMGPRNMARCIKEAQPTAFIGVPISHFLRRLLGWSRRTIRINVVVGSKKWSVDRLLAAAPGGVPTAAGEEPVTPDAPAAICFTSGSTGVPKGVVYTHATFHAQVEALHQLYGMEPGEVDLATFAHFSFFHVALGLTTVFADMDFVHPARANPVLLAEAIADFGVTSMFGSPALLNVLGRWASQRNVRFPSLRRVISAGAPVPLPVIRRIQETLRPGVQVFTPYGATEALPVSSIGSAEILGDTGRLAEKGSGVCVGRPCAGIDVRIIKITDEPIAQWSNDLLAPPKEIGEIAVRGPGVTESYFNRPHSNALAKIASAEGVYHRMGDLGYLDDDGRLWYCGRKSQRVQTPSQVHFTEPCEGVFNAHPGVFRSALVPVGDKGATEPGLCVQLEAGIGRGEHGRMRAELLRVAAEHPHTRAIKSVYFFDDFPVDVRHNAKISREKLAVMIQKVRA
jgi:acyl-CoA synthetase (AMP-forming)/AMP-acid ligase II/pimeloyl-ACP methyl ester carboxylesterase